MIVNTYSGKKIDTFYYIRTHKNNWNVIVILYIVCGYYGALTLMLLANIWLNSLGIVLLTHSLVLSAYMSHDFMHGAIFTNMRWNAVGGNIMLWLNGGCYAKFKHL